jgi:hypothetical protein
MFNRVNAELGIRPSLEFNDACGGQNHRPHSGAQHKTREHTATGAAARFRRFDELLEIFVADRSFTSHSAGSNDWKSDLLSTHVAILVRNLVFCRAVFG